jgi:class 3 adenylate cyclase
MSTESLLPHNSALLAGIESIESDAVAMKVAQKRSRLARLVIMLLLAVAAVVFVYLFLSLAARFTDGGRQRNFAATALNQFFEVVDMDERAKAEGAEDWEELLNQYSDVLVKEMEDLGKTSMPIVQQAFSTQINKDMPKHRAMFNEQRDLLMVNLQTRGDELLQARYQKILNQHKTILKSEFEGMDDAKIEQMLAHINIATNRLLRKYYYEEIEGQIDQLKQTFDEFAIAEPTGGETLNQQLLGTSVELLRVKFVGDPIIEEVAEEAGDAVADDDEPKVASNEAGSETADDAEQDESEEGKADEDVSLVRTDADDAKPDDADQGTSVQDEDAKPDEAEQDDAEDAEAASDEKQDGETETDEKEADGDAEPES